ncbi:hypothetical protein CISG_09542 [Coccidioides immitis RMSCC 3703]|uniref:Major facilitator superfamily (MFS) profile domain-containing protein n=1 Tax=Coccidioides immitis RMSCC 3703 TaxID=454286 RepID=A0A0J8QJ20_COCIT|nr:hypothetical protein CISG_09542 [Coccidioides immitis RMSCC 3703]
MPLPQEFAVSDHPPADAVIRHVLAPTTRKTQLVVLISSFLTVIMTIGPNLSYGVFQEYYVTNSGTLLPPSEAKNRGAVALVGTVGAGLTWAGSIFVNPLMTRVRGNANRNITLAGCFLMSLAYGLAGSCDRLWQLALTQGLMYGLGSSMLYFPLLSIAPEYFDQHRGLAMGFILSGAGVGGLILSPTVRILLDNFDARWILRILALANLAITFPIAFFAPPSRSTIRRPTLVNPAIVKKPAFILQSFAALLQASGNFVPMTFLSGILHGARLFGLIWRDTACYKQWSQRRLEVLMGFAADNLGRQNTLVLGVIGSAVSVLGLWLAAANTGGQNLLGYVCGDIRDISSLAGGYNALFPTTVTDVFGVHAYASVNGFLYFIRGLGAMFGSPVGGLILGSSRTLLPSEDTARLLKDYQRLIWYDGALLVGSSLCVIGVRGFDALEKRRWAWKA